VASSGDAVDVSQTSLQIVDKTVDPNDTFYPVPGFGKRAHVTLGTSEGVRPVNTGIDLLDAIHHEKLAASGQLVPETHPLPGTTAQLRRYNSSLWVLYPDREYIFDAVFTGHY
jgi:hypothetical protein